MLEAVSYTHLAGEDVEMQVRHGLTGGLAGVRDDAESGVQAQVEARPAADIAARSPGALALLLHEGVEALGIRGHAGLAQHLSLIHI